MFSVLRRVTNGVHLATLGDLAHCFFLKLRGISLATHRFLLQVHYNLKGI